MPVVLFRKRLKLKSDAKKKMERISDREIIFLRGPAGLLLTIWEDSKTVCVLSNYYKPQKIGVERRVPKRDYTTDTSPNEKENHD